jgi:lipopolysaccharide transport system ATP-binding protein
MYTRLAFAVAAHLEPEILVVDEVLSVGDADFQEKSRGKMTDVAREGRTILFVSHNLQAVTSLCTRAMLLEQGQLRVVGSPQQVVAEYRRVHDRQSLSRDWQANDRVNSHQDLVRLRRVAIEGLSGRDDPGLTLESEIQISVVFDNLLEGQVLNVSVHVYMSDSVCVFNTWSDMRPFGAGRVQGTCRIPAHFLNAQWYRLGVMIVQQGTRVLLEVDDAVGFEVREFNRKGSWFGAVPGAVRPQFEWTMTEESA